MYLEILDDFACNKVKPSEKLFNSKKSNINKSNDWFNFSLVISNLMAHEIAYKYCFSKAKSKVTGSIM